MRILVISDIHANYPALEAVLASAVTVDAVWCLGDLVGYGPFPNECIERISSLPNLTCLMGNHDSAVAENSNIDKFNDEASNAIYWTKRIISDKISSIYGGYLNRSRRIGSPWPTAVRACPPGNI
jgi:predicted phosphodiesterase